MQILIALILAAAPGGAKIQHEAEERARAEAADLLKTLCPEQCVLLSVQAQVADEDVGGDLTPGFDAPGARTVPVLRAVSASVLVDQRLPAAFRSRVRSLVAERLKGAGVPSEVTLQQVSFPVRNPPYLEPQSPPVQPPAAAPSQPPIAASTPVAPRMEEKLLENAPLLVVVTLLGAVLLVLGALLVFAARGRGPELAYADDGQLAQPQSGAQPAREPFPAARSRKLEKQLTEDRALRNAVVREALSRGEHALVASWVRELGDFLLEDLRGDGALAPALSALATEVTRPADAAARAAALQELEGRALSVRLSRAADSGAFAFLEGVREEAFAAAFRAISAPSQEVALRLAPAHLRAAVLRDLPAAQRQEIALAWVRKPEVTATSALAAADELRERLLEVHSGASEADRALGDLLDTLSREEQDALLERLRREGDARAGAGLLTESALAYAPADLLASAVLGVAPSRLVSYLGAADGSVRAHLLSACPAQLRRDVEEELSLRPGTARDEFLAARRELLSRVREETARRGLQPAEIRAWRPRVVSAP